MCGKGGSALMHWDLERPPLWSRFNIVACHLAGSDLIPGRVSFPGCDFFQGFSSAVRQMTGSFRPPWSPNIIWPSYHRQSSFIMGANDLRCWRALKSQIYIHTWKARWLKRQGAWLRTGQPGFDTGCRRRQDFSSLLRVQGSTQSSIKWVPGISRGEGGQA